MNEIKQQVARARRRMVMQHFVVTAGWSIAAALLVALIAIVLPRLFVFTFLVEGQRLTVWFWSWLSGALAAGIVVAGLIVCWQRRSMLDAAIELDRRCCLKERVSSVVGMDTGSLTTAAGKALLADAAAQVSDVDVAGQFGVRPAWQTALPILPLAATLLLLFVTAGATPDAVEAASAEQALREQVKQSEEAFRQQIVRQRKRAEQLGLEEAARLLREIEKQYETLAKAENDTDRKQALLRLNNVKQQAQQLKDKLARADEMRKQLNQLKNLPQGPADRASQAIRQGDFGQAEQEMKKLADQVRSGELNQQQQDALQRQLDSLQQQLNKHEQAKQALRQKIDQARRDGQSGKAAKLEEELNRLAERDPKMQQLKELAENLERAAGNVKSGDRRQAAKNLEDAASQLKDMQRQMDQLQSMDRLMDQIAQAKNSMNCQQCQGKGCQACQGRQSQGQGRQGQKTGGGQQQQARDRDGPLRPGDQGTGQGSGDRAEEKTEVGTFQSKVDGDAEKGEVVRVGTTGGANVAGRTRQQVKAAVIDSLQNDPDPVDERSLPRAQREHTKEFFQRFREGKRE